MSARHPEPGDGELLGEELDPTLEAELAAGDLLFRDSLADLFSAPPGLVDRTREEVAAALLGRSTALAGVELLSTGWHTVRLLFGRAPQPFPEEHP